MRRELCDALDSELDQMRQSNVECETLTDQTGHLVLMFVYIGRSHDTSGTVSKYVDGQSGIVCACSSDQSVNVGQVIGQVLDVVTLALRPPASSKVEGICGKTVKGKLFARPNHITAVRIES